MRLADGSDGRVADSGDRQPGPAHTSAADSDLLLRDGNIPLVLLDLQIETMATRIHAYWVWHDSGWYYGVPLANFVAWWLVGLFMALLLAQLLPSRGPLAVRVGTPRGLAGAAGIPAWLYLLSTLMFTLVNMMRGYPLAGLVGLVMLLSAGLWALLQLNLNMPFPASQRDAREAE